MSKQAPILREWIEHDLPAAKKETASSALRKLFLIALTLFSILLLAAWWTWLSHRWMNAERPVSRFNSVHTD